MGILKGRQNCVWEKNWEIVVYFNDGTSYKISEQLTYAEATKIYKQTIKEYKNKKLYIEFMFERETDYDNHIFIPKIQIQAIHLRRK